MRRIICIGDLCADLIVPYGEARRNISAIRSGELKSQSVELRSGGTVGNASVVLGKLGSEPIFITDLCDDGLGRFLRSEMERHGVDMSYAPEGERGAMVCIAVLDDQGDRTMFSWLPPGAGYPTFSESSFSEDLFSMDAVLFTGGMTLSNDVPSMDAVYSFIKRMKQETDSVFVFDLNARIESYGLDETRRHYYDLYIELADVVLGSGLEEFGPIAGGADFRDCALRLSAGWGADRLPSGRRLVIARDGAGPVLIAGAGSCVDSPDDEAVMTVPVEPVRVISTVGAGDAFDAAFMHAMNRGVDVQGCVAFANRIAGHVISHEGQLEVGEDITLSSAQIQR